MKIQGVSAPKTSTNTLSKFARSSDSEGANLSVFDEFLFLSPISRRIFGISVFICFFFSIKISCSGRRAGVQASF